MRRRGSSLWSKRDVQSGFSGILVPRAECCSLQGDSMQDSRRVIEFGSDPENGRFKRQIGGYPMTEMVYGALPVQRGEPVLPKWWRTLDKWSMTAVLALFGIGLLLGMAASPPLAEKNGFPPFHYVEKQVIFGGAAWWAALALACMLASY